MKKLCLLFLIFSYCFIAFSNSEINIDSLINEYENSSDDIIKLELLVQISQELINRNDFPNALKYVNTALTYCGVDKADETCANLYYCQGEIYNHQGNLKGALEKYNESISIFNNVGNKEGMANTYIAVGRIYTKQSNYQQAFDSFNKALKIGKKLRDKHIQSNVYSNMAYAYLKQNELLKSIQYSEKYINILRELNDKKALALALNETGMSCVGIGNFNQALEYYFEALEISETETFNKGIQQSYKNIGVTYGILEDYENALKYYNKAKEIADKMQDKASLSHVYTEMAELKKIQMQFQEAIEYYNKAVEISAERDSKYMLSYIYGSIASTYLCMNDIASAEDYSKKSLKLALQINAVYIIAKAYGVSGMVNIAKRKYKLAIEQLNKSYNIGLETNDIQIKYRVLQQLYIAYKQSGHFEKALECHELFLNYSDSIRNKKHIQKITQLQMQAEFDKKKKEQEYAQLQKEKAFQVELSHQKFLRNTMLFISGLFILLVISLLYIYRLRQKNLRKSLELQKVESEKKQELYQMKLRFFTNISHDLRTPLTLIKGPLEKILNQVSEAQVLSHLKVIYRNTVVLHRLVDQVLDFNKLDSGNLSLQVSENNIISFIYDILKSFEDHTKSKNIQLKFHPSENELFVLFDPDKLEKIMYNLISNAIKYTNEGGCICIEINILDNKVSIMVEDNGIGISPDQLDKIFERYYQANQSELTMGGSGIGLALTKELVELHHGKIIAKNRKDNGTKFILTLPNSAEQFMPGEIVNDKNTSKLANIIKEYKFDTENIVEKNTLEGNNNQEVIGNQQGNVPTVLVVEDNTDMRNFIYECLESEYRIISNADGLNGFESAVEIIPDIIISDIMMPGINGIELCKRLKKDIRTSHIPIVLLTAKSALENQVEGLETGADDYIIKPFNEQFLKARLKNLIDIRQKLKKIYSKNIIINPEEITSNSMDKEFLQSAIELVEKNLSVNELNPDILAAELNISRSVLYRKIKSLTDESISDFIRNIRLKKAARLLLEKELTVSQISYDVGYSDPKYFSKSFRKYFGYSPTEFVNNKMQELV